METGPIKTFVFLDLETTGLPQCSSPAKITEISFVAVAREQILEGHDGIAKENRLAESFVPRVLNKINFTIYPRKMILPAASAVSGLSNENLVHQKPFDENLFNILQLFIDRLEKPVCLVAHNGLRCDFPILKSELIKIRKELSEDLFCVDSLPAFREVLTVQPNCEVDGNIQNDICNDIRPLDVPNTNRVMDLVPPTSRVMDLVPSNRALDLVPKCGFSQEDYDQEMIRTLEFSERIVQENNNFSANEIQIRVISEMENWRKTNETTPVRKSKQSAAYPMSEHTKRKILNDPKKPKPKLNLGAVYERVLKKELVDAHRAECDALALLECVVAIGLPIMEWMDSHKIPFKQIKRIW